MGTLVEFLKHGSAVDLLFVLLVVLSTLVLVIAVITIAIASRNRKPLYFLLFIGLIPMLLALFGTYLKVRNTERLLAEFPDAGVEVVAAARQEEWIIAYIGVVGTTLVELIALTGLILKKDRSELA
jgi:1-acyl-sn-glycerol-3-phosphate acyltransferase